MPNKEERKISPKDIQEVQKLIEWCLLHYMSQSEVVRTLDQEEKIDPSLTELVWQNLEAENKEFFRGYHIRVMLKDQIQQFNNLLEKQVELMRNVTPTGAVSIPISNASHILSMPNATIQVPEPSEPYLKTQGMCQVMDWKHPNVLTYGIHPMQSNMPVNMPGCNGNVGISSNMVLGQSSNSRIMQGFNGVANNSKGKNVMDSPTMFPTNNNTPGCACLSTFANGEPSKQPLLLHEPMMNRWMNSFGFSEQMNRPNVGLPTSTSDFHQGGATPENYSRKPFLGMNAGFFDPRNNEKQPDNNKRLCNKPKGFNYKDFGSR